MKAELREMLGKAAYESIRPSLGALVNDRVGPDWESLLEGVREVYCDQAEAAVKKLAEMLIGPISSVLFTEEDIKRMLEDLVQEKILTITPE